MCSVGAAGRPDPAGGCAAGADPLRSAQGGQGRGPGGGAGGGGGGGGGGDDISRNSCQ